MSPSLNPQTHAAPDTSIDPQTFERLARLVHDESGIVLSDSKKSLVVSRLSRRMRTLGVADFPSYCRLVESNDGAEERRELIFLITTNVTRFFREDHHFAALRSEVMPDLAARARKGGKIRCWSAGCSSGEEPYSIAITMLEAFPQAANSDVRVLATDLDGNMVQAGRQGIYAELDEAHLPPALRERHFQPVPDRPGAFAVTGPARDLITFAELNLLHDWPMKGPFDFIFCRNVVIYFDIETQQRLWSRFAALLAPGGRLFVGHSERVTGPAAAQLAPSGITQYRRL